MSAASPAGSPVDAAPAIVEAPPATASAPSLPKPEVPKLWCLPAVAGDDVGGARYIMVLAVLLSYARYTHQSSLI